MLDVEGFILAGGASSRMGADKARLAFGAQTLVDRIAAALGALAERISIVSARSDHVTTQAWPFPVVTEKYAGAGALAGLHGALVAARSEWVAVVACDLPFVTGELFLFLAARAGARVDAVAPVQADGRPQPLCALYKRASCLPVAERLLAAGERRPRVLLASVQTRWVLSEEMDALAGAPDLFANLNTPADYARALEKGIK